MLAISAVANAGPTPGIATLKARPVKLHHAAANVDREDNHAPGTVSSAEIICLTPQQRLDDSIKSVAFRNGRPRLDFRYTP
jgi:hypothetical protein